MKAGYKSDKVKKSLGKGYEPSVEEMRPHLSLDTNTLPEVKDWKVDKTYTVTLEIKQTGIHKQYGSDGFCADFVVMSAKAK